MYYFAVMIVGVWGGRKVLAAYASSIGPHGFYTSKRKTEDDFQVRLFVANRDLPLFLGIGSMTATWVGGGYLNGTAEAVYKYGIINCHAPIGYAMSLVLGGAFFATKMRLSDSLTMLDPFQTHYGRWSGLLFCVPAVLGEIFWTAAILAALGKCSDVVAVILRCGETAPNQPTGLNQNTVQANKRCRNSGGDTASVIIRVEASYFIIISGSVIFLYTALGGLYSVTYTDALQVATTGLLLWACVPACMSHKAVGTLDAQYTDWIGTVAGEDITQLLDFFLMTALGGIPWQVYFQRVLSCPTVTEAKILSFMAAIGCILLAVPPVLIGVTAKHTNFTIAGYPHSYELNDVDSPRVLPFTIVYLTSGMTAIFGLVSIAAAVMSSADSSMLSASTMITRNVYQTLLRPAATELEVVITLRIMICALGSLSVYMALSVNSVFDLWTLCSDIVYVLLFPQLLCVFYFKETNAYGSVMAFIVGGVFRCLCGEPSMNIPVVVRLPLYDPVVGQRFPFRLLCMVLGLCTLLLGSDSQRRIYEIARSIKPQGRPARPPDNIRRALTTDATVPEKEAPNNTPGAAKDNRKASLAAPVQTKNGDGCGPTRRKSLMAPDRKPSDVTEVQKTECSVTSGSCGTTVSTSGVPEKTPTDGATTYTKTSRKKSVYGSASGGSVTRKKCIAGAS
ncbi:hypothetical protein HPB51_021321 [Rhipicephalus microplus]|uniref:High-affinity choline transporter 1 n=1 Tax=Rhipicephalus microplus TaxID=6941 RepID=A0A9J6F8R6_RHIMP|nr:hypothetical protein HPB51_021321 [Rhipicephalus microplus]